MRILFFLSIFLLPLSAQVFDRTAGDTEPLSVHFLPPAGYVRVTLSPESFGAWLRKIPVIKKNVAVRDYRGRILKKSNDPGLAGVAACRVAGRSLDQCMDILMRFYAGYLRDNKRVDRLVLPLPDGLPYPFKQAQNGNIPFFKGLHFQLVPGGQGALSLQAYLRLCINRNAGFLFSLPGHSC